jgi:heparinase II/III-like protein
MMCHVKRYLYLILLLVVMIVAGTFSVLAAASPVVNEHPRLFFRQGGWNDGLGLTPAELRLRYGRQDAAVVREQLGGSLPNDALRALILQAWPDSAALSRAAAERAIARLREPIDCENPTTEQGLQLSFYAMAFDWLYGHPSFDDASKKTAKDNMATAANSLIRELGSGSHIFHTRMYGWALGVALAGLALDGEHPEAKNFVEYGGDFFQQRLFPARRLQDGAVHNSFGYGRKYTMWQTGHFISCWHSATGENLWQRIDTEQDGWARQEMLFNIYGRYPDGTYLRFGDSYSLTSDFYSFRAVSERVAAYRDPVGQGFLQMLIEQNAGKVVEKPSAYVYFLNYDPELEMVPVNTLPPAKLFSRDGLGMAIWKSGWQNNGTTVFFKCGNYFGDHGHFDQGHVDIFRRAPLLIDSGHYLTFSGEFRTEYWHRTVAHNSILITDPALPAEEGGQRVFHSQDDDTIGKYLSNTTAETGDLLDYVEQDWFSYAAGDLTAAYPAGRVESVTREVAFVDNRFVVVLDKVRTVRPELVPRVLWHCPTYPRSSDEGRRFIVDRQGGRAIATVLLPESASVAWVDSFEVGGRKIQPVGKYAAVDGMGVGRFEITDPAAGADHLFLTVIEVTDVPADPNAWNPPPGQLSAKIEDGAVRIQLDGREFRMRRSGIGLLH